MRQALLLQVYYITVIGYHYPTLILLGSLVGIALAAGVEVVVFGVIEYQMRGSEFVGPLMTDVWVKVPVNIPIDNKALAA